MNVSDRRIDVHKLLRSELLMKFADKKLENDFCYYQYTSRLRWIRVGLFLAIGFAVASSADFIPFVSELLPKEVIEIDRRMRFCVLCPMFLFVGVVTFLWDEVKLIRVAFVSAAALAGLSYSSLVLLSGSVGVVYYGYSFVNVLLFIYIIVVQPFRIIFMLTLGLSIFHVGASLAASYNDSPVEMTFVAALIGSAFVVLSYGSYFMEFASRSAFVSNLALNKEYEEKLAVQEQRSNWLGLVADFLRHEMKNSMIGISSSLQLVQRRNRDTELQDYVSRARKSIDFMWRMLEDASRATSLESALSDIRVKDIDLSRVVRERVAEYGEMYPEHRVEAEVEARVIVKGDAEKLVQLLDKLMNNAIEHADSAYPIRIKLSAASGKAVLRVSDTGDPLRVHGDTVFQPFVSKKVRGEGDNFGLGLYVVKRIAAAHQGQVAARGFDDPPGAEFTVVLPLGGAASGSLYPVRS